MKYKLKRLHNKKFYYLQPHYTCMQCAHLRNCQCMYLDSRYEFAYPAYANDASYYICKNFERKYRTHNVIGKNWRKYYNLQGKLDFKNPRPLDKVFVAFKETSTDRRSHKTIEEADTKWIYFMSLKNFVELNWYKGTELNWDFRGHYVQKAFTENTIEALEREGRPQKRFWTFSYEKRDGTPCTLTGEKL